MSAFVLPARVPVLVGGGRSLVLGSPLALQCASVSVALARAGHPVHVGCAAGADAVAVHALLGFPGLLRVFAVGLPSGAGFWRGSAFAGVQAAASAGVPVRWCAGGALVSSRAPGSGVVFSSGSRPPSSWPVPLTSRLFLRSVACLRGCGLAVFFAPGPGSCSVARAALRSGVPVLFFCAFPPELPVPAVASSLFGLPCWLFSPPQLPLFESGVVSSRH